MKEKQSSLIAFGLILICIAFVFGYLLGHGNGETNVSVSVTESKQPARAQTAPETEQMVPMDAPTEDRPLDLNTATVEQLDLLPGIGTEYAKRIVAYRETNGRFVAKEQIMDVDGIGEKRYAEIEALIVVGGSQ